MLASNPSLADGYAKHRIKSSWASIAGNIVADATEDISFKGTKMFVKIKSAIIRSEIMMIRNELTYRINQEVGTNCIDEIIVR